MLCVWMRDSAPTSVFTSVCVCVCVSVCYSGPNKASIEFASVVMEPGQTGVVESRARRRERGE